MISKVLWKIYTLSWPTKYLLNLFVLLPFVLVDIALNTITGGAPMETISGRLSRVTGQLAEFITDILELLDENHCDEWEFPNAEKYEAFNLWRYF